MILLLDVINEFFKISIYYDLLTKYFTMTWHSLTSNIQASVLLKYSTKRLTSAVFTAYTRVVDSCQVEGSNDFEVNFQYIWEKVLIDG